MIDRPRWRVGVPLLLVGILLVTGCSGLQNGPQPGPTSDTVTPVPVPEDAPDAWRTAEPNVAALLDDHRERLDGVSYTRRVNETAVYQNGTIAARFRMTAKVGPERRRMVVIIDSPGDGTGQSSRYRYTLWVTDDRAVSRLLTDDDTQYRNRTRADAEGILQEWTTPEFGLDGEYPGTPTRVVTPNSSNERWTYRMTTAGTPGPSRLEVGPPLADATATATVTSNGLVRQYAVRYPAKWRGSETTRDGGTTVTVTDRVRFVGVGNTTVQQPQWVENASGPNSGSTDGSTG